MIDVDRCFGIIPPSEQARYEAQQTLRFTLSPAEVEKIQSEQLVFQARKIGMTPGQDESNEIEEVGKDYARILKQIWRLNDGAKRTTSWHHPNQLPAAIRLSLSEKLRSDFDLRLLYASAFTMSSYVDEREYPDDLEPLRLTEQ